MEIRRAAEADFEQMWEMFRGVIAPGDTLPFPADTDEAAFRAMWFRSGWRSYVAFDGGRAVGMYEFGPNQPGRGSHVANATYIVSPDAQGRGVGRALVLHSLAEAAAAGFLAMQFNYVVSTNAPAVALYEKLGFSIVGSLPRAFRHETLGFVDALVMYRLLEPQGSPSAPDA